MLSMLFSQSSLRQMNTLRHTIPFEETPIRFCIMALACPHSSLFLSQSSSHRNNFLSAAHRYKSPGFVSSSGAVTLKPLGGWGWSSEFLLGRSLLSFRCSGSGSCRREGGVVRASWKPEAETEDEKVETEQQERLRVDLEKDISKAVRKTVATFAPRASSARNKNPAQPGSTLYSIFEVQAYVCMLLGGVLSFNLLFPSDQPDLWRLMGMWSVWMFTIPSLRARDCPQKEKDALNYLFLAVPLINVTLPIVWKSFAAVWSADVVAFLAMYAWKLEWLGGSDKANDS